MSAYRENNLPDTPKVKLPRWYRLKRLWKNNVDTWMIVECISYNIVFDQWWLPPILTMTSYGIRQALSKVEDRDR